MQKKLKRIISIVLMTFVVLSGAMPRFAAFSYADEVPIEEQEEVITEPSVEEVGEPIEEIEVKMYLPNHILKLGRCIYKFLKGKNPSRFFFYCVDYSLS